MGDKFTKYTNQNEKKSFPDCIFEPKICVLDNIITMLIRRYLLTIGKPSAVSLNKKKRNLNLASIYQLLLYLTIDVDHAVSHKKIAKPKRHRDSVLQRNAFNLFTKVVFVLKILNIIICNNHISCT